MKVTKQHKILGAVLIAGAMALTSDRLFFLKSSGNETTPESSNSYAIAAPAKTAASETAAQPAAASISVAQRLRTAAGSLDTTTLRDAFALGAAWAAPVAAVADAPTNHSAEQFRQTHHLTGALISGAQAHAMIDDRIVAVGESIDGYRLVSISHRSATLKPADGEPVILNMNERVGGNPTASASVVP